MKNSPEDFTRNFNDQACGLTQNTENKSDRKERREKLEKAIDKKVLQKKIHEIELKDLLANTYPVDKTLSKREIEKQAKKELGIE